MTTHPDALVFDTGPLRHFAEQGWLGVLHFLAKGRAVVIPESVEQELTHQALQSPSLNQVLDASWIMVDRSDDTAFLIAFARYADRLAVGRKNRGECGVLALGAARGHEVVLDESVARTIAEEDGMRVTSTLALLCNAIREGELTVQMVEMLADDLIAGDYYLPFSRGDSAAGPMNRALSTTSSAGSVSTSYLVMGYLDRGQRIVIEGDRGHPGSGADQLRDGPLRPHLRRRRVAGPPSLGGTSANQIVQRAGHDAPPGGGPTTADATRILIRRIPQPHPPRHTRPPRGPLRHP